MGCLLAIFLVLAVVFAGAGFALHLLWVISGVFVICWLAGFAFAKGSRRADR